MNWLGPPPLSQAPNTATAVTFFKQSGQSRSDGRSDKVSGFKADADDYLTKQFRMEELVIELRALLRRAAGDPTARIECGARSVDALIASHMSLVRRTIFQH